MNLTLDQAKRATELVIEESRKLIWNSINFYQWLQDSNMPPSVFDIMKAKAEKGEHQWLLVLLAEMFEGMQVFNSLKNIVGGPYFEQYTDVWVEPLKGFGDPKANPAMNLYIDSPRTDLHDGLRIANVGGEFKTSAGQVYFIDKNTGIDIRQIQQVSRGLSEYLQERFGQEIEKRVRHEVKT